MSTPRFFCQTPLAAHQRTELPNALAHHAIRVLRLKNNSQITLFDGNGGQYDAELIIEGKSAWAQTGEQQAIERELPGRITLVQGLAAGDKMDWIIEKAVEMGVSHIVPIAARRSVLQLSGSRLAKRLEHWDNIVKSACEQCGRNRLPSVVAPTTLAHYLSEPAKNRDLTLLCHPQADQTLAQILQPETTQIRLLVGPEGGWSDEEIEAAHRAGAVSARFGTRVLRTETAGLALVSAVSALQGWY